MWVLGWFGFLRGPRAQVPGWLRVALGVGMAVLGVSELVLVIFFGIASRRFCVALVSVWDGGCGFL